MFRGNLPPNFSTIDRWSRGKATNIKSLDLDAVSYQSREKLYSRLSSYIERVGNFKGTGGTARNPSINPAEIRQRKLLVVVPHRGSADQWKTFEDARYAAKSLGVKLKIVVH